MRWEDEDFVKVYTRDTPEWLALSWQARCLFLELIRKVDRAGVMQVGRVGLRGLALTILAPWEEIEPYVNELIDHGRLIFNTSAGTVVIPKHVEAQQARQSDALRKRRSREAGRAASLFNEHGVQSSTEHGVQSNVHGVQREIEHGVQSQELSDEQFDIAGDNDTQASSCHKSHLERRGEERRIEENRGEARGTRIRPDWIPSVEVMSWAASRGVRADAMVEEFRDYWLSVPAQKARKANWDLTFKNHIRRQLEFGRAPLLPMPVSRPVEAPPDALQGEEARQAAQRIRDALRGAGRLDVMSKPLSTDDRSN